MAAHLGHNAMRGEKIFFDNLMHRAYRGYLRINTERLLERMVEDGVLQIDALLEKTISVVGRIPRDSGVGRDFRDGSDAKKVTSHRSRSRSGLRNRAQVRKIANKKGILRVMVAETVSGQCYYFRIPYQAYRHLKCISIPFDLQGQLADTKWKKYQVSGLTQMCG
jgi:Mor family transcriptional regulator